MTLFEFLEAYPTAWAIGSVILGLIVGSFLNVVIHRLPIMMEREWKSECRVVLGLEDQFEEGPPEEKEQPLNLAFPQSHCPNCKAPITAFQNIPILSYLILGGKCANCKVPISLRYPGVELLTGLLSGYVAWHLGAGVAACLALLFTWTLISLTLIDFDHQLLPDQLTLPLLWLGLLINTFNTFASLHDAVWGAIAGYLVLWTVYQLFKLLTGKEGMGFGDFKLLAAIGAWLGWQALPLVILLSSLVGAVLGGAILFSRGKNQSTPIPFGPFLAIAGWIAMFWGTEISNWYWQIAMPQ